MPMRIATEVYNLILDSIFTHHFRNFYEGEDSVLLHETRGGVEASVATVEAIHLPR